MVAEYLDKNYDRVSDLVPGSSSLIITHSLVLRIFHHPYPLYQLRDQTTITEITWRDSPRSGQLQRDDTLHFERGQPQDDDEPPPR